MSEPNRSRPDLSTRLRIQIWLLRLGGTIEMLAFCAVVLPLELMERAHSGIGMGPMPQGTLVEFMIRQASFCYGMHGILMWVLSFDVQRFEPLVQLIGWTFLIYGPVFAWIEWKSGAPWWWTTFDPIACSALGLGILLASPGRSRTESPLSR